ncbi:MAG: cation transporter [Armatimonadetes bacterium]|nr:cation transporter [Armatimonadota bacterium]
MAGHTHGATSGGKLWLSLALTLIFVIVEAGFGWRARSLALLSDAGHNASDALALGLAAYAVWVARRPASAGRTFGYHRVAILTALANAAALVVIALAILAEAVRAFVHPEAPAGTTMMAVAAVALLMNTVIAYWLRGDSHHSLNARAAYVHMAGDALSSLAVLIAGAVVRFTGWTLADPVVSVLIALFILYSSWGIIGDATNILLEGAPKDLDVAALVAAMNAVPPVRDVHDLHVWTVGDGIHFLSCHVVLPEACTLAEAAQVVCALNTRLHDDFGIGHATIQTELPGADGCRVDSQTLYCALEPHGSGCGHGH